MAKAKPTASGIKSWQANSEDVKILNELKEKLGIVSDSELVRMGLRKLAQAEGLRPA